MREKIAKAARAAAVPAFWKPLAHGVAPSLEHRRVLAGRRYDVIVDVGANRGQFSLLARQLNPAARIYAFEPHPAAAAMYRRLKIPNSTLQEIALADAPGEADLHVAVSDDQATLLRLADTVQTIRVRQERLADVLAIDALDGNVLLKLDVQGVEHLVLQGALPLLHCFSDVLVELTFQPEIPGQPSSGVVIDLLRGAGFDLEVADAPVQRDGLIVGFDGLFHRG